MKKHGRGTEYSKALTKIDKKAVLTNLKQAVTHKLAKHGVPTVFAEIAFLSSQKRCCLVIIHNQTSKQITYHKCFVYRGSEPTYSRFDMSIQPNEKGGYSFEKHSSLSLTGCAAMIFLSAIVVNENRTRVPSQSNTIEQSQQMTPVTLEQSPLQQPDQTLEQNQPDQALEQACFFVVAFTNYAINKFKKNKAVLMIVKNESFDELSHQFEKVMGNKHPKPKLSGAYDEQDNHKTFVCSLPDGTEDLIFKSLKFTISHDNDDHHSMVTVTVT